jgi:hypothetical protein
MNNPVWLKVMCIVSICLASLGILVSIAGLFGQLMIDRTEAATVKFMDALQQGIPQQTKDLQKQLQHEIADVQRYWQSVNLCLAGVNLLVAGILLAGGILALRMKPGGRKLLLAALAIAAVFVFIRLFAEAGMQWQISKTMGPFMEQVMQSATPPGTAVPPAQRQMMQKMSRSIMVFSMLVGFVTTLSLALVKIAFYVAGIWLLRRPHIKAMYTQQFAPAELVE